MSLKNRNALRVHKKDSIEEAIEKNEKLLNTITKNEKELRTLRSENKTLKIAWEQTEKKYKEAVTDISLKKILEQLSNPTEEFVMRNLDLGCSKCYDKLVKVMDFKSFKIIMCSSCGHKEKLDEEITG